MNHVTNFKALLLLVCCVLLTASPASPQNMLVNGGFETEGGWTVYGAGTPDDVVEYIYPYTNDRPTFGSGSGSLYFYGEIVSGGAWINGLIWQEMELIGGATYVLDAAWKYLDGDIDAGSWFQFYVSTEAPVDGVDWTPSAVVAHSDRMYGFNSWSGCSGIDIDGTFMDDSCDPNYTALYRVPGEAGQPVPVFLGLKTGAGWGGTFFEILVDDISFRPNLVVNGDFEDETGWTLTAGAAPNALEVIVADSGANGPALGKNKYLSLMGLNSCDGVLWQKIDLVGGAQYSFNAGFRQISGNVENGFWCDAFVSTEAPVAGQEWKPAGGTESDRIAGFNSASGCSGLGVDGTFRLYGCGGFGKFTAPGAVGVPVSVYLGFKVGCTAECGSFEVTVDDVSLVLLSDVGTLVAGKSLETPKEFTLDQNYPNPFNPTTEIHYSISTKTNVNLTVYDVLGHTVATLVNEVKNSGSYKAAFNADGLSSGIYLYKLQAEGRVLTKRMLLMK